MHKKIVLQRVVAYFFAFCMFPVSVANANDESLYLQLGSFNEKANATRLTKIAQKETRHPIQITKNNDFHVVRAGPFLSEADALKLKQTLKEISPKASLRLVDNKPAEATLDKTININNLPVAKDNAESPPAVSKPAPMAKNTRLWNLRQADIRSVIHEVAKETGKNFVIDPRVQGKISIVSGKAINAQELYQVFLSMLQVSGYAAIPSGDVTKIIPNIDARTLGGNPINSQLQNPKGDDMVVNVVSLNYVPAEQLVPVLRPLMPQWSSVSAYAPSNTLILSGRSDNIKRLANIVSKVDSSDSQGIDVIPLQYALAMDVASTLKALMENRSGGSGRNSYNKQATTVAADDKTNAILVSGPKPDRLRIRVLISQLDIADGNGSGNTEIVYLRYLRAQDLIPILSGIAKANFSGNVGTTIGTITAPHLDTSLPSNSSDSSNNPNVDTGGYSPSNPAPQGDSNAQQNTQASTNTSEGDKKPKVELIAEPNTNAIIISAPSSVMRTLRRVIAKLDMRPSQLLVEALVAEIDAQVVNQLGLEWGTVAADSDGNNMFQQGFAIINSRTSLSQFQAQLYALITSRRANILSTPSVVVLDNHQAKILVGKEVSIQDSNYPGNAGGGGTTNPYNTFTRKNVALHLYVRPQISQGKSVQLQIDQGNDTLADPADATSGRPVINTSNINTSVLVNSGDVLVLGGLIQNGLQKTGSKLPILGDIPGIGEIFQRNQRTREKKVLMIFIRPIILNNDRSNFAITGSKYYPVRNEQLNWLENEPYNAENKGIVLPSLDKVELPKPFTPSVISKADYGRRKAPYRRR